MEEEDKKIRHTISAEETFTLAKDVFDIRTFIKNVYSNRAVIARRVNIITLCVSLVFTLLYATYVIIVGVGGKLSLGSGVIIYSLAGAYAAVAIVLTVLWFLTMRTSAKSFSKLTLALKIFRVIVRLLSIAVSVAAIVISMSGEANVHIALDIIIIIFAVFTMLVQIIPMLFGGMAKFVRWLLSPVKVKVRFSTVALEWYGLAQTGKPPKGSSQKIAKKHYKAIGVIIDSVLNPALGNKYINTIKPVSLLEIVANSSDEERELIEGILNSVFAYAAECGYVAFNPCRDLNFTGTVEEPKKKTMKDRIFGVGKNIGKRMLDKYIAAASDDDDGE